MIFNILPCLSKAVHRFAISTTNRHKWCNSLSHKVKRINYQNQILPNCYIWTRLVPNNVRFTGLLRNKGLASGYDECEYKFIDLSICSMPTRYLNLLIVAYFPSTTKVSWPIKAHSFIAAVSDCCFLRKSNLVQPIAGFCHQFSYRLF